MFRIFILLLLNVILIRAGRSTLSFVIDNSGSMGKEIDQVRRGARDIMDIILNFKSSQIEDIVLVTFNDPVTFNQLKIKTRDPDKLQAALDSIEVFTSHNADWPEYSLSGITLALNHSQPNSYLFVFTDASAKDFDKVELIKNMCQKTQTQIMFILTDYCDENDDIKCKVYHEIALACGGQVFIVDKDEVYKVIEYIKETVRGEKSITKIAEVPANEDTQVEFHVDEKTEYVLISASGKNVKLKYINGPAINYKFILSTTNTKALRLDNPTPGTYWATVYGTSQVIVHVFSRTDFLFEHGFSKLMPKSITDTSKQPIADSISYLAVQVTDPEHEVSGKVLKTKKIIKRSAKAQTQPLINEQSPVTKIIQGSPANVNYNGTLQLSCAVTAYPEPSIIWMDSKGKKLQSVKYQVTPPNKYVSNLTLQNVIKSGVKYVCIASNILSSHKSSTIVRVFYPLTVEEAPPGITNTPYNQEAVIKCKITSQSRLNIYWFKNNKQRIIPSHQYILSSDKTELKIRSAKLDSAGRYTCKAVVIGNPKQYKNLTTVLNVIVDEKAPVASIIEGPLVEVPYDGTVMLTCTVTAYPAPTIVWKNANGMDVLSMNSQPELPYKYTNILTLNHVRTSEANYFCVATNNISRHQSKVKIATLSPFTVVTIPPASISVRYAQEVVIKCHIESSSPMRIDWFQKKNHDTELIYNSTIYTISSDGTELKIKSVAFDSAGQYVCKAVLTYNPSQYKEFTTDVTLDIPHKAPIMFITEGPHVEVVYNHTLQLTCMVSAYPAPDIIWKDGNGNILPSETYVVVLPYEYKTYLIFNNVKPSVAGNYECVASNKLSSQQSAVDVTVLSPYTVVGVEPPANITVFYDHEAVLQCNITSSSPMRIDWFRKINNDDVLIDDFNIYTISPDGTELKIISVALDSAGQYTCKAVLIYDSSQHKEFTTDVNVAVDHKAPVISIDEGLDVLVEYNGTLQLTCTVTSYPAPEIIWKDENANILPSESYNAVPPYEFKSNLTLNNTKSSGTGNYYCVASNNLASQQSAVNVTVLSPYTIGAVPLGNTTVQYDHEAVIECTIKSTSPMHIDWFRKINNDNILIDDLHKYTISSDGTELRINTVTLDSAGQYTCKAVLIDDPSQHMEYITDVTVAVDHKAPVTIITEGHRVEVAYNGALQLSCTVTAYPAPNIIWKDENDNVLPSKKYQAVPPYEFISNLTLINVKSSDAGIYYCVASNELSSQQSAVHVVVLSPFTVDVVTPASSLITAQFDQEAVIKCTIKSTSRMRIDWFRKVNGNYAQINSSGNFAISSDGTELRINTITLDSAGQYTCKAVLIDDPSQHKEYTTDVTVAINDKAPVTIITEGPQVEVPYNGTIQLTCTVNAYPAPDIIWKDEKGKVLPSKSSTIELPYKYKNDLMLDNTRSSDTGNYYCVASNKISSQQSAVNVTVLSPYTVGVEPLANITVQYNQEAVIQCNIKSSSPMRIDWFRKINNDNELIDDFNIYTISNDGTELKINSVNLDSAGQYICEAVLIGDPNQHKEYTTDVTVVVDDKAPVTSIDGGLDVQVAYNGTLQLTCTVTAYPAPEIIWKDENKTILQSTPYQGVPPYEFKSNLTLNNVKSSEAGNYYCVASNKLSSQQSAVNVSILSPYNLGVLPPANIMVRYSHEAVLLCNIKSSTPMRIDWFRKINNDDVLIDDLNKYTISSDGTQLIIKSVALDSAGQYTCKAVLIYDSSQQKELTMDVNVAVDDKAPVPIITESPQVEVAYNSTVMLTCMVFAYPAPNIIWKDNDGNVLLSSSSLVELPYKYVSNITVNNVITNGTGYVCVASNKLSTQETTVNVTVLSPFSVMVTPSANTTALYGEEAVIKCVITSSANTHIKWFRKVNGTMQQIDTSDKIYTISPDDTELKINPVTINTTGEYICKAVLILDTNQYLELSTDLVITDFAIPVLQKSTSISKTKLNKTVAITCNVINGNPKPVLTWMFKRRGQNKFIVLPNNGEELKLLSATLSDAGIYQCIAINEIGSDKHETELFVEAPPTVELDNGEEPYLAVEGDRILKIPCNAVGYPKPDIIWSMNGSIIVPDEKFAIEDGTLIIKNPISNDTRVYTCDASNKLGNVSQPFEVQVNPYLDFDLHLGDMHYIYIHKNESTDIKCLLANKTTINVRWYLEGLEKNDTGTVYQIMNAKYNDSGNYTCRVNTELGSSSSTYRVVVGSPPKFKNDFTSYIDWNGEKQELLGCAADGEPLPEVKWLYNGEIIKAATKMEFNVTEWGSYVCELSNPFGNITRSFEVSTSECLIDTNSFKLNNTPLILTENLNWPEITSTTRTYLVPPGYSLKLFCKNEEGSNYFQRFPGRSHIIATCDHMYNFLVDGVSYKFSDFTCAEEVSFVVERTGKTCTNDKTELINVGFNLDHFVEVYSVCYDNDMNVPLYAHVGMSSMNTIASAAAHSWFRYPGIGNGRSVQGNSCGEGSSCCYGKSQLINARDVSYGPAQKSTFIDHLNSIILWHPCEHSPRSTTWLSLEDLVRTKYEEEPQFPVWSGASGYNITKDGEAVPRYLWKVFSISNDMLAVVFINDKDPQSSDVLCTNICGPGSNIPQLKALIDSHVYCCEMEDFTMAFGFSPYELREL